MAGGIRGGRGAREIIGLRESGLEARPRAGMSSLPGGLGAERRLPELAAAADAKRRFDERHRRAIEFQFHRAFAQFENPGGRKIGAGWKPFLSILTNRPMAPKGFVEARPARDVSDTLEAIWKYVTGQSHEEGMRQNILDIPKMMDAIQIARGHMEELAQRGFLPGERLEFLKKYHRTPLAKDRYYGPFFTFYERETVFPLPEKSEGGDVLELPRYSSKISWNPKKGYWRLRTDYDHLPGKDRDPEAHYWSIQHGDSMGASGSGWGIPIYVDSKLQTVMRSKFLPEVVVAVEISLRTDPITGKEQAVVVEKFSREDPLLRGSLPPW
ncbi:hypothetical protein F9K50_10210 [bacterium]|nr:MAG: hypothetical protein F9K50_10210 [bacterium]